MNAWKIYQQNDLSQPLMENWKLGRFICDFPNPGGTMYCTADPHVMAKVFEYPRKDPSGIFYDLENKRVFVEGILNDLFPEEIKEIGVENAADQLVVTAENSQAKKLRIPLLKALHAGKIEHYKETLDQIADNILNTLSESEKNNCNAALLSFEYAVTVVCQLFTGYNATRHEYQELAHCLEAFSKRMTRIISHKPATSEEDQSYQEALVRMRKLIKSNILASSGFIQELKKAGWNDFQIQSNLFFFYFAASETTAAVMNYLFWQLGRMENQELQHDIRNAKTEHDLLLIIRTIGEALRRNPSAFIEGRQFRENTLLTIKNDDKILFQKELLKKHSILCMPQVSGSDPFVHSLVASDVYANPDVFNPYRFAAIPDLLENLDFLPFGGGRQRCPGQYLATAELKSLFSRVINKYNIETIFPLNNTRQVGFFTLKATPAQIRLKPLTV